MKIGAEQASLLPDSAAVFASALSLWHACHQHANGEEPLKLSECYNGVDQFMREVMRVANQFEAWACLHIDFNTLGDVWPYLLEDKFGESCLAVIRPSALAEFDDTDCLRVSMHLRLPILLDDKLPVPVNETALNPVSGSPFRKFRIQTVRNSSDEESPSPYSSDDDPFDEEFGFPYFGLYGVAEDELLEHIADRATYREAVSLVCKLAPGVQFPITPTVSYMCPSVPK